jgi:hypothetical protein
VDGAYGDAKRPAVVVYCAWGREREVPMGFAATVASSRSGFGWSATCTRNEGKGQRNDGTMIGFGVGTVKSLGREWSSAMNRF